MKPVSNFFCFTITPLLLLVGLSQKISSKLFANETAVLSIVFNNVVGNENMVLKTGNYINAEGEEFTISQLQYFISNIMLHRKDGKMFVLDQDKSYFLVQGNNLPSQIIKLEIPVADYDQITFMLGVDSLRNTMDISRRIGVLDPGSSSDNGMYWGWNSGYIFFKMEGISPSAPVDPTGERKFRYHIGGFGGYSAQTINNLKTISLPFPQNGLLKLKKGDKAKVRIKADVLKVFNGSVKLSIADHANVMFSEYSVNIANNYSKMFTCDQIENQ